LREDVAHFIIEKCIEKSFHADCEKRMATVILVGLTHWNKRRPECPLATLRYNNLAGVGEVGGKSADKSELESSGPSCGLNERGLR